MSSDESFGRLRVQTVLFGQAQEQLWRLLQGLSAAARKVQDAGLVTSVDWALGDSSSEPVFGPGDAKAMFEASDGSLSAVTYEVFGANLGSSGGQNHLARGHPSEFLLVLNPDTYPSPTALVELVDALSSKRASVVEARQIPLEHPRYYDPITGETSWASGFCMLVARSVFDELDGFDSEHFLLHCDDVDFSWRARARGHKVIVAPYATVFHDKRPRVEDSWPTPDAELYHAALGRLMLATRWDRPDVVEETIAFIESGQSAIQREALAEFQSRMESRRCPSIEQDAESVAQFIDGEYAAHRF